jgi:hypothetical protein
LLFSTSCTSSLNVALCWNKSTNISSNFLHFSRITFAPCGTCLISENYTTISPYLQHSHFHFANIINFLWKKDLSIYSLDITNLIHYSNDNLTTQNILLSKKKIHIIYYVQTYVIFMKSYAYKEMYNGKPHILPLFKNESMQEQGRHFQEELKKFYSIP